ASVVCRTSCENSGAGRHSGSRERSRQTQDRLVVASDNQDMALIEETEKGVLRETIYSVSGPRLLGVMTSPEVAAASKRTQTVLLAAGSIEAHGPHLPLLSDFYQGEEFIRRVVAALALSEVEVLGGFCIQFTPAEDTLSLAGTVSVRGHTFGSIVTDVLASLY